jgi:hypothetical protein
MLVELQRIADRLGSLLDRPVAIDDMQLRQFVYTYHPAGSDPAREQAILRRHASPEILRWIASHRTSERRGAFLLPSCPEIGLTCPRLGVVARVGDRPVAYIWVQVDDAELTDAQRRHLTAAAEDVADVFRRQQIIDELRGLSERESLIQLLSGDAAARARAVERIADADIFHHDQPASAAVFLPVPPPGCEFGGAARAAMNAALESVRATFPSRQTMGLIRQNHGLLVIARAGGAVPNRRAADHAFAETARRKIEDALAQVGPFTVLAGVGGTCQSLADIVGSYRQALQSAQVAAAIGTLGPTVHHADLGIYAHLVQLTSDQPDMIALHPGIRLLIDRETDGDPLAETLEVFLDNAGDVARAARCLHLHRASLYGRLRRVEEITGLDLSNGHHRLIAHLELKLARLLRLRPGAAERRTPLPASR